MIAATLIQAVKLLSTAVTSWPFWFGLFSVVKVFPLQTFTKSLEKRFRISFFLRFTKLLEFALNNFNCFIFLFHNKIIYIGQLFHCDTDTLQKNELYLPSSVSIWDNYMILKACHSDTTSTTTTVYSEKMNVNVTLGFLFRTYLRFPGEISWQNTPSFRQNVALHTLP